MNIDIQYKVSETIIAYKLNTLSDGDADVGSCSYSYSSDVHDVHHDHPVPYGPLFGLYCEAGAS